MKLNQKKVNKDKIFYTVDEKTSFILNSISNILEVN